MVLDEARVSKDEAINRASWFETPPERGASP